MWLEDGSSVNESSHTMRLQVYMCTVVSSCPSNLDYVQRNAPNVQCCARVRRVLHALAICASACLCASIALTSICAAVRRLGMQACGIASCRSAVGRRARFICHFQMPDQARRSRQYERLLFAVPATLTWQIAAASCDTAQQGCGFTKASGTHIEGRAWE